MNVLKLELGQVLMGNDFMDWEVVDGNVPRSVAWEWMHAVDSKAMVAPKAPVDYLRDQMRNGAYYIIHREWTNYAGVVVLVPTRDVKMALAIRRVDDKFQLLGRRGG